MSATPTPYSGSAHALPRFGSILQRHDDGSVTVHPVESTHRLKVVGAEPFYRSSTRGVPDADFTHVVVKVKGIKWPLLFGADNGHSIPCWEEQHHGDD